MKWTMSVVSLLLAFSSLRCSDVQFQPGETVSAQTTPTPDVVVPPDDVIVCETGRELVAVPTKIILLLDQSGSNVNGPYGFPGQATDPQKSFRLRVVEDFFESHYEKSHVNWALITFQEEAATARSRSSVSQEAAFADSADSFRLAIDEFRGSADRGPTPYQAALRAAEQLIAQDIATSSEETQYKIAFITDGFPTDYCPGGATEVECPGMIRDDLLDQDLSRLVSVASSRIEFSAIYYGLVDPEASERLARMAGLGSGQFVDANLNQNIQLNDLIQVDRRICREN